MRKVAHAVFSEKGAQPCASKPKRKGVTPDSPEVIFGEVMVPACGHWDVSANRRDDLGEATRILVEKAGWHFQAVCAPLDDIWTESIVTPWSGRPRRRDSGGSAGFFAFFT